MSASLVGSEMCIRDSNVVLTKVLKFSLNLCNICSSPPEGDTPRVKLPVSYTHLTLPTICSV
eukprot:2682790-Alexandrium_andersonii.AAC.1